MNRCHIAQFVITTLNLISLKFKFLQEIFSLSCSPLFHFTLQVEQLLEIIQRTIPGNDAEEDDDQNQQQVTEAGGDGAD